MSSIETSPASTLVSELPEILNKIEANWPILPSGIWNSSSIQRLSRHLHELARRSEHAGAENLQRVIYGIDEAINEIIDDGITPNDQQIDELNNYLEQLRGMAGEQRQPTPVKTTEATAELETSPFDLIYLSASPAEREAFTLALEKQGLKGRILFEAEALQPLLVSPGTTSLLIDCSFLAAQALEPTLHMLKMNKSTAPALSIISDQSTIEARLNALRAGATQQFSRPIEMDRVIEALLGQIHPLPQSRPRVLIVEDDESQANFAAKLLQKGGLETLNITDPLGVINAVTRFQPDLILMDLYMPGADGIELTRVIRDRWETSSIPVVFLSGEGDPEKKLLALQAGADDFLTKPVRPQQLLATVGTRIARARQIAAVAVKQVQEKSGRLTTRRELLTRLDLELASGDELLGFYALLVICLVDPSAAFEAESAKVNDDLSRSMSDSILPLLQAQDTLANLGGGRLALLYRRHDEDGLEALAAQLFETLSQKQDKPDQRHIGLGMVLLNGAEHNAYEQLCRAEASAESAYEKRLSGFELYGEEVTEPAEVLDATATNRNALLKSITDDLLEFHLQRYNSRRENGADTFELLPLRAPTDPHTDLYEQATTYGLSSEFNQYVCLRALQELGEWSLRGERGRLIFKQSSSVVEEPDYIEFIKQELRRRQIVGTGLMVDFDLPTLAANLKAASRFIGELSALGIATALSNFACNETAYKVLAYLKADAIRPHPSLLRIDEERIQHIATQIQSLHAEIILPCVTRHNQLSLHWSEVVDYIQANFIE
jgi:CheY-like chemotaxis protein/EAL domain-containing protein (putative c-di-GMP-specific phosphodiesterase class I)/GGDEF domain-containing protein